MGWKRYIPVLPFKLLIFLSYIFELLNSIGLKNPIHHRRIEKLYYSTDLSTDAVLASGFKFKYTLKSALEDWKYECGGKGLFQSNGKNVASNVPKLLYVNIYKKMKFKFGKMIKLSNCPIHINIQGKRRLIDSKDFRRPANVDTVEMVIINKLAELTM